MLYNIFNEIGLLPTNLYQFYYKYLLNCDKVGLLYAESETSISLLPCVSVRQFCSPVPLSLRPQFRWNAPLRVKGEFGYLIRIPPGCLPLEFNLEEPDNIYRGSQEPLVTQQWPRKFVCCASQQFAEGLIVFPGHSLTYLQLVTTRLHHGNYPFEQHS